jgi:hypothetical protein
LFANANFHSIIFIGYKTAGFLSIWDGRGPQFHAARQEKRNIFGGLVNELCGQKTPLRLYTAGAII